MSVLTCEQALKFDLDAGQSSMPVYREGDHDAHWERLNDLAES